ncbi:MAG: carbohydrate ABC transporter permease, partial [Bacilli bacterium]
TPQTPTTMSADMQAATMSPAPRRTKRSRSLRAQRQRLFYILISPWLFGFLAFTLGPMIYSGYLSLTQWNLLNPPVFIGMGNYQQLLQDPLFWQSLKVTTIYAVVSVPLQLAFALFLAVLLNQRVRGLALFRTILYLPSVVSGVAVSVVFMWVFNPSFGIVNAILHFFGITGPGWIQSPTWALPTMILMSLWSVGSSMIIFLAGLQNIPPELHEAASIDGAGIWRRFLSVTIPLLTPTILFNLILSIINQFQLFTQAYVMTNGGPLHATLFYVFYLWQNAFQYLNMGYAAAMAWILFFIVLILTVAVFATSGKWVFYQGGE